MNRKPKWKIVIEATAKVAPFLAALGVLLRELRPYVAPWLG